MIELHNADCMKVLPTMADGSVDLVVTDCPYHIVSGGCRTNDGRGIGGIFENVKVTSGCLDIYKSNIETGAIFDHNSIEFSEWLPEVYRVLKDGTHCYIMVNARNLKDLWVEAEKVGFTFQNLLVWDKGNATPNKWYMQAYELILMLRKGLARNINNMGEKNILRVPNVIRTKLHPTEKPVELMMILIENSSNEGDTVLDPFMGVCGGVLPVSDLTETLSGSR